MGQIAPEVPFRQRRNEEFGESLALGDIQVAQPLVFPDYLHEELVTQCAVVRDLQNLQIFARTNQPETGFREERASSQRKNLERVVTAFYDWSKIQISQKRLEKVSSWLHTEELHGVPRLLLCGVNLRFDDLPVQKHF